MKRFVLLYFLFLSLLFGLFYAPTSSLSVWLNGGQTRLTLWGLSLFLDPDQLKGIDIWINPHYRIYISQACNGMIPILFLFAAILAYPSRIWHKIVWLILGYLFFAVTNVVRLLWVTYATTHAGGHEAFWWAHDIVGNALLVSTGFGLFVAFVKTGRR
jgi:exosortase/archaeosortase family protein